MHDFLWKRDGGLPDWTAVRIIVDFAARSIAAAHAPLALVGTTKRLNEEASEVRWDLGRRLIVITPACVLAGLPHLPG